MSDVKSMSQEEMIALAGAYNSMNDGAGASEEEIAARAAAKALEDAQGNTNHQGQTEVRADTPEEIAAREAAEKEAAEKKAAEEAAAAEAAKTPEQKAEEAKATEEAEAKEEAEKAEAEKAKEGEEAEWVKTDSKEFNAALGMLKAAGMTPDEAGEMFQSALDTGDLSKVDQAALIAKVGEDNAALIMSGFTNYAETQGKASLERVKTIHDEVGGTDNWNTMRTWAQAKAKTDPAFHKEVAELGALIAGDNLTAAKLAAKSFMDMYNADPGNSSVSKGGPAPVTPHGAPTVPTQPTITPLSAREYADAVEDASKNLRGAEQAAKIASLRKARDAGRAKGL